MKGSLGGSACPPGHAQSPRGEVRLGWCIALRKLTDVSEALIHSCSFLQRLLAFHISTYQGWGRRADPFLRQSRCSEAPGLKPGAPQPTFWSLFRDSDLSTIEAATEVMALHHPEPVGSELERPRGHPTHFQSPGASSPVSPPKYHPGETIPRVTVIYPE